MFKSISGKGILLEQRKEPALSKNFKEFVNEKNDVKYINGTQSEGDISRYSADGLLSICEKACITDESDGVLLYYKLLNAKKSEIKNIIVDAVDDEPYISNQVGTLLHMKSQLIGGLDILKKILDTQNAYIAVYKHMGEIKTRIPRSVDKVKIRFIRGKYPTKFGAHRLADETGSICVGACSLIHLYRAVTTGRIQTTTFVTVAGSCIFSPVNMEVPLGMTVTQILKRCGMKNEPVRIVVGGSMTGVAVTNTDKTHITHTTNGVLAFHEQFKKYNFNCIGCDKCISSCPKDLAPMYIFRNINQNLVSNLSLFDIHLCIGCGICSYVCPAKLNISSTIYAKAMKIRKEKAARQNKKELVTQNATEVEIETV